METTTKPTIEFKQPTAETFIDSAQEGARIIRDQIKALLDGIEYSGKNPLVVQVTQNGKPVYFEAHSNGETVQVGRTIPDEQTSSEGERGIEFNPNLDSHADFLADQTVHLVASVLVDEGSVEVARIQLGNFDAEGNRIKKSVVAE